MKVVILAFLACSTLAMRIAPKTSAIQLADAGQAKTTFDFLMCDKMCMQCPGPNGRNILITREKGTIRGVVAVGVGLWTLGVGNALAGCDKIGFEFWKNRLEEKSQPLQTEGRIWGMFPISGLEKLRTQTEAEAKRMEGDMLALEQCEKLGDAYFWQALHGAFSLESGFARQQEFARQCLSHSELCGAPESFEDEEEVDLNVARWNPWAHEDMCSAPKAAKSSNVDAATGSSVDGPEYEQPKDEPETPLVPKLDLSVVPKAEDDSLAPDRDEHSDDGNKQAPPPQKELVGSGSGQINKEAMTNDAEHSAKTVDAAGDFLDSKADTSIDDKKDSIKTFCHSTEQKARCAKLGITNDHTCADRCCMDACNWHIPTQNRVSAITKCLKKA